MKTNVSNENINATMAVIANAARNYYFIIDSSVNKLPWFGIDHSGPLPTMVIPIGHHRNLYIGCLVDADKDNKIPYFRGIVRSDNLYATCNEAHAVGINNANADVIAATANVVDAVNNAVYTDNFNIRVLRA